jgi:glutathione peroxidase
MSCTRIPIAVLSAAVLAGVACGGASRTADTQASPEPAEPQTMETAQTKVAIIDHTVESLGGESVDLAAFRGRPMLIVNTASKCGYTPQYEGLQALHERYGERGLAVIGFPSNDFGNQEPGSAEEIGAFCRMNYGVSFPMMAKIRTKGDGQSPLYATLTSETPDGIRGEVRWNFTKFLVAPDGRVTARFEPAVAPLDEQITSAIEELLEEPETAS